MVSRPGELIAELLGRRVVLLCGAPGAGKTTRARELAELDGLDVFDRDDRQWSGDREYRLAVSRLAGDAGARAVVIRSCPTRASRQEWTELAGATDVELLRPSAVECCRRVIERGTNVRAGLAGIKQWFAAYDADEPADDVVDQVVAVVEPSREW